MKFGKFPSNWVLKLKKKIENLGFQIKKTRKQVWKLKNWKTELLVTFNIGNS